MNDAASLPRLVGTSEIRAMLGVHRSRVGQLVNTKGFPDPVYRLGRSHVWLEADVIAWARAGDRELHPIEGD